MSDREEEDETPTGNPPTEENTNLAPPPEIRPGWINQLKKEELVQVMEDHGLDVTGTVPKLRNRLIQYWTGCKPRSRSVSPVMQPVASTSKPNIPLKPHKWNLKFNGRSDPVAFLERLEEIRFSERIQTDRLLPVLPEILTEAALLWYRNNKKDWKTWNDFVTDFQSFYLPADYESNLEEEISRRVQRPNEAARDYLVSLQTLIRRHGKIPPDRELFWIHRNLLPEYRLYIPRHSVRNVPDLLERLKEYEALRKTMPNQGNCSLTSHPDRLPARTDVQTTGTSNQQGPKPVPSTSSRNPTSPNQTPDRHVVDFRRACWKCGKTGHLRSQCTGTRLLFCSKCGKKDTLTRDCTCRQSEN